MQCISSQQCARFRVAVVYLKIAGQSVRLLIERPAVRSPDGAMLFALTCSRTLWCDHGVMRSTLFFFFPNSPPSIV
jgi:hypothetical protein